MPHVPPDAIHPAISLRELGANSIDRADVVVKTLADLSLKITLVDLSGAHTIGELVGLLAEKLDTPDARAR